MTSLLGLFFCVAHLQAYAYAQDDDSTARIVSPSTTIPFELTEANNILIAARLNGTDTARLMLHTGVNAVSVTSSAAKKLKSVTFDQTADVSSWGGEQKARLSSKNTLQIGELSWDDVELTEGALSGHGSDGKFGLNLFANKVIEIDFDHKELKLYESLPSHLDDFVRLPLTRKGGGLFVRGQLQVSDAAIEQEFLIHSGYSGTLLLDDAFVAEHGSLGELPILSESELKDSYGNIIKTRQVQLPKFALGELEFSDVPAGYFPGTVGRQRMSVLGGGLLRRFVIAFDAKREHIFLRPGMSFAEPFATT